MDCLTRRLVVSLEASRALAHRGRQVPRRGRAAGMVYNTFDNDRSGSCRFAREELAQRASRRSASAHRRHLRIVRVRAARLERYRDRRANVNYTTRVSFASVHSHLRSFDCRTSGAPVALLVEAAGAGNDAEESWWPDVKVVRVELRDLLRERR